MPEGKEFGGWNLYSTVGSWSIGKYQPQTSINAGQYGNITLVAIWNTKKVNIIDIIVKRVVVLTSGHPFLMR